ncbi:unnamed protein product [Allacma fusca]|uniref:Ion transport domain-containing protein n=1 Tax=Allacma fusca TaxID=39272 RepID=A0A8J2PPL2_9HEXA|nr:unnamed protein product [Allacma fusca]
MSCSCNICIRNVESCCAVLLNLSEVDVNIRNTKGETPLHVAAFNELEMCTEDLIRKGADCYIVSKNGDIPMSMIAAKIPDLYCKILDQSISISGSHHKCKDCIVKIDFRPLILTNDNAINGDEELRKRKCQNDNTLCNEVRLLNDLLSTDEETKQKIFSHPVVDIFLNQKGQRRKTTLIITVIFRLIWLLCYTNYIISVYLFNCPCRVYDWNEAGKNVLENELGNNLTTENTTLIPNDPSMEEMNGTNITDSAQKCFDATTVNFEFFLVLLFTIVRLSYDVMELFLSTRIHWRDIFQIIVMGMVFSTFFPTFAHQTTIPGGQYQLAALTVFVAWCMYLSVFGKFRKIGGYFEIYAQVLRRFVSIIPTFIFLYSAFALAFCVLFPKKSFFSSFGLSFIRVLIMTMGTDYEAMFYGVDFKDGSHGPVVGHLLYAAFVIVVSVLLLNLLIGLTVSDIQNLQKQAKMRQITIEITNMYNTEYIAYSDKLPPLIATPMRKSLSLAEKLVRGPQNEMYFQFKINDPRDTTVVDELKMSARPLVERIHNERQSVLCEQRTYFVLDKRSSMIYPSNLTKVTQGINSV